MRAGQALVWAWAWAAHGDRPGDRRTKRWASMSVIAGRGKGVVMVMDMLGLTVLAVGWRLLAVGFGVQCRGVEGKEWVSG